VRGGDRSEQEVTLLEEGRRPGARRLHERGWWPGGHRLGDDRQRHGRRGQRSSRPRGRYLRGTARHCRDATAAPCRGERRRPWTVPAAAHRAQLGRHDRRVRVGGLHAHQESQRKQRAGGSGQRHPRIHTRWTCDRQPTGALQPAQFGRTYATLRRVLHRALAALGLGVGWQRARPARRDGGGHRPRGRGRDDVLAAVIPARSQRAVAGTIQYGSCSRRAGLGSIIERTSCNPQRRQKMGRERRIRSVEPHAPRFQGLPIRCLPVGLVAVEHLLRVGVADVVGATIALGGVGLMLYWPR